jgi:hypothetical protein
MDESLKQIVNLLPLIIPIMILELALMVIALIDVIRREPQRVRWNKVLWIVIIVAVNIIGPVAYLLFGRQEVPIDSDKD